MHRFALLFSPKGEVRVRCTDGVPTLADLLFQIQPIQDDPDDVEESYFQFISSLNVPVQSRKDLGSVRILERNQTVQEFFFTGVILQEGEHSTLFEDELRSCRWTRPMAFQHIHFERPLGFAIPILLKQEPVSQKIERSDKGFTLFAT